MPDNSSVLPHEILELKEILSTEMYGLKKLQNDVDIVNDDDLKTYMEKCLENKKNRIGTIQNFIENNESLKNEISQDENAQSENSQDENNQE